MQVGPTPPGNNIAQWQELVWSCHPDPVMGSLTVRDLCHTKANWFILEPKGLVQDARQGIKTLNN